MTSILFILSAKELLVISFLSVRIALINLKLAWHFRGCWKQLLLLILRIRKVLQ